MDPLTYNEVRTRPSLEERLESIISGAALMADSSCTRDDRRERIVQECNAVRQALQDLLTEYMNNVSCFHLSPNAETLKENYLVFTIKIDWGRTLNNFNSTFVKVIWDQHLIGTILGGVALFRNACWLFYKFFFLCKIA